MKKNKSHSRKENRILKAKTAFRTMLREIKKRNKKSYLDRIREGESYNQREKKAITDYLRCQTQKMVWIDHDYYYVETEPGAKFYKLIPRLHKHQEAREWLDYDDGLRTKHIETYVREICRIGVTREIEMAYIWAEYFSCYGGPWRKSYGNVLIKLHEYGHEFSPEARNLMKRHCDYAYRQIYHGE